MHFTSHLSTIFDEFTTWIFMIKNHVKGAREDYFLLFSWELFAENVNIAKQMTKP